MHKTAEKSRLKCTWLQKKKIPPYEIWGGNPAKKIAEIASGNPSIQGKSKEEVQTFAATKNFTK